MNPKSVRRNTLSQGGCSSLGKYFPNILKVAGSLAQRPGGGDTRSQKLL